MRSFLGISNHGPYVGVSISRRHGRRSTTKHYARPASNLATTMASAIQAQKNLAAANAKLDALRTVAVVSDRNAVEAFERLDRFHADVTKREAARMFAAVNHLPTDHPRRVAVERQALEWNRR